MRTALFCWAVQFLLPLGSPLRQDCRPLNEMLRKRALEVFEDLTPEQLVSFQALIEALTSAPIICIPKPHQPYSIDTHALD